MTSKRITRWLGFGIMAGSLISCAIIATMHSVGLVDVTMTALPGTVEPKDHDLPLIKQKDALPDYEIIAVMRNRTQVYLGCKPNRSAVGGLNWPLTEPISVAEISSLRLRDKDELVSDTIAEVQLAGATVTDNGYSFTLKTERSFALGLESFFKTPIGKAITAAFVTALVTILTAPFLQSKEKLQVEVTADL